MYKVGVLLSGCGVMDGSEIHEAVITLLALDKEGIEYLCIAPNKDQSQVINHITNQTVNERRNMLVESARIARGNIKDLNTVNPKDFDAIILPGGFGAACNLSTFANDGTNAQVLPEVENFLKDAHSLKKPIGAICIAPNIIAKIFGKESPQITIGTDKDTAHKLEQMGAKHINKNADEITIDENNLFVTTPAYMLAKGPRELDEGITKLVKAIIQLVKRLKKEPVSSNK